MHDEIRRFYLEGAVTDEINVVQHKERLVYFLESSMRDEGYVPLLDMDPQYTQSYNHMKDWYEFELSVYGVAVESEKRAWQVAGMMSGRTILRHTQPAK